jgi:hypothetical protein
MKKTNVMIEVSEDLYNEIVEPYKKRKGFGKLVVQLLEAYRTNESIYSYINGTIDGLESEATEELLKDLNNMAQSLNMFGVYQNQAEVVIDEGQRAFNEFSNQAREDSSRFEASPREKSEDKPLTKEDVISIVNDSVSDMKNMLEELLKRGTVTAPVVEKVQEAVETKIHVGLSEAITEPIASSNNESSFMPREVSKEEEDFANDAFASLLGSASF